jgi:hypothetical protein
MNLNETRIALLDQLYRDASKGLLTAPAFNTYLKQQGQKGFTIKNIKEYLDSLETTQTSKLHYSNVSYGTEHPLDQFQIDIVYMSKSWFNHNYKIITVNICLLV